MERRLAAILAADVVEYSRLIGEDQAGTLAALRRVRADLLTPAVEEHDGNLVKSMGDGWLVEFASVSNAVACAQTVQTAIADDNMINLRIGIHIGEVVFEEEDVFGDGVNIASRLEALAQPGEILISDTAHQSLDGKAAGQFVGGEQRKLKNIARPVALWRWPAATENVSGKETRLALPDKPSIAVLPFDNMSGDPEQDYFADGMTEDIITALSRLRWLFVIARNSSFHYKGMSPDVRQVAKELGVRYILEGSVRKVGARVRITAQLIDAMNGNHIWADRFDRRLTDIFDLQDELTEVISGQVDAELAQTEREEARIKPNERLDAWDCYKRGMWHAYLFNEEGNAEALRFFEEAVQMNSDYAPAHAGLSLAHFTNAFLGYGAAREEELAAALAAGRRSVACDERDPQSHWALGRAYLLYGEVEQAIAEFKASVTLNPNYALGHYMLGWALNLAGRAEKALDYLDAALRLSPRDPLLYAFMIVKCQCYFQLRDFDQAWEWGERSNRQSNAHYLIPAVNLAVAAAADWPDRMRLMKAQLLQMKPDFVPEMYLQSHFYQQPKHRQYYLDAFAKAGIEA